MRFTGLATFATALLATLVSSQSPEQQAALDAHNNARNEVGVTPLVWDDALAAGAQQWADHLASTGQFEHSGTEGQGENLYQGGRDNPWVNAVNLWVAEKANYHEGETVNEGNLFAIGHYTQVVWGDTTHVGMAVGTAANGNTYVVARYTPPGNFFGQTPY